MAVVSPSRRVLFRGSKLVCVAKNYAAHAVEMGGTPAKRSEPAIFLKPRSSVPAPGKPIVRPREVAELHHEVELASARGAFNPPDPPARPPANSNP